mmetsp:Transcript_28950/g.59302  ORF Transcript_28950/g.59302 Transcript_28950/m.59302 type:complete len:222 (-) Transcript_28950:1570-2235(-)
MLRAVQVMNSTMAMRAGAATQMKVPCRTLSSLLCVVAVLKNVMANSTTHITNPKEKKKRAISRLAKARLSKTTPRSPFNAAACTSPRFSLAFSSLRAGTTGATIAATRQPTGRIIQVVCTCSSSMRLPTHSPNLAMVMSMCGNAPTQNSARANPSYASESVLLSPSKSSELLSSPLPSASMSKRRKEKSMRVSVMPPKVGPRRGSCHSLTHLRGNAMRRSA